MPNYRVLIFGNGCFRSWVTFLLLLPVFSPWLVILAPFVIPPVYLVAALEEWVFGLVVDRAALQSVSIEKLLKRLLLASLIAPIGISGLVLLPLAMILFAPVVGALEALTVVGVATGAITVASFLVMVVRRRAIADDLLDA